MQFIHNLSGRTFTVTGEGPHGAKSMAGFWQDGTAGVIWPDEPLGRSGQTCWRRA